MREENATLLKLEEPHHSPTENLYQTKMSPMQGEQ